MNTKTITTRSIPLVFISKNSRSRVATMAMPWKTLNIMLSICFILALVVQALLTNYINTGNLRLQELAEAEASIQNEISELNIAILDAQSLEAVTSRARELGMTPDGDVVYLTTVNSPYVKR